MSEHRVERRGFELAAREGGSGPPALLIHQSCASNAEWGPVAERLAGCGVRAISYDRRGWGSSGVPEGYQRSLVGEHTDDAFAVLDALGEPSAIWCGSGIGAVMALDAAVREPRRVAGVVLVEPPLLSFAAAGTAALSEDRAALEQLAREVAARDVAARIARGEFEALAPGAGRLPDELREADRPVALFAEIGAVAAWSLPLAQLDDLAARCVVAVGSDAPALIREAAAGVAARIPGASALELTAEGTPAIAAADELAEAITSLSQDATHGNGI